MPSTPSVLPDEAARARDLPAREDALRPRGMTLGFPTPWQLPGRTGRSRLPCTRTAGCFQRTAARPGSSSSSSSRAGANWWAASGSGWRARPPGAARRAASGHGGQARSRRGPRHDDVELGAQLLQAQRQPLVGHLVQEALLDPRADLLERRQTRLLALVDPDQVVAEARRDGAEPGALGSVPSAPARRSTPKRVWRSLGVEQRQRRRHERLVAQGRRGLRREPSRAGAAPAARWPAPSHPAAT